MNESTQTHSQQPEEHNDQVAISRRRLLRILTTAGGAVAASTLLPSKWVKPVVEVGVLPAHAQISEDIPDTIVQLTWYSWIEARDLDLRSVGDSATVDENAPNSPTMAWAYEENTGGDFDEFIETITIISAAASGNYEIYVYQDTWGEQKAPIEGAILAITLPNESTVSKDITNSLQEGQWLHCATIDFNTFTITWYV